MLPPPPRKIRSRKDRDIDAWKYTRIYALPVANILALMLIASPTLRMDAPVSRLGIYEDLLIVVGWWLGGMLLLFLGAMTGICFGMEFKESWIQKGLLRSGIEVSARIVQEKWLEELAEDVYEEHPLKCEFLVEGKIYEHEFARDVDSKVLETRVGNEVPMLYNPRNPEYNRALGELAYVARNLG